jgi:hypothetical protein
MAVLAHGQAPNPRYTPPHLTPHNQDELDFRATAAAEENCSAARLALQQPPVYSCGVVFLKTPGTTLYATLPSWQCRGKGQK